MKSLKTTYAGLELRNPIVVGSCEISSTAERCAKVDAAGAGAIVLKSLFEEDVVRRTSQESGMDDHSEGADYLQAYHSGQAISTYTTLIKDAKKLCSIPIIASLNCHSLEAWVEYSKAISQAGADALQLNVMSFNYSSKSSDGEWEQSVLNIIKAVKESVEIPLIVKLSPNNTNPASLINRLYSYGVKGVALFNTPYPVTIDAESMSFTAPKGLGAERSMSESLRWIALSSPQTPNIDYALCSGVSSANCIVSSILVGAAAAEVVGALYANELSWITDALKWIEGWMERKGFDSIEEFQGRLNASQEENREYILRWQYITT